MTGNEILFLAWFVVGVSCVLLTAFRAKSWIASALIALVWLGVGYVMGVIK